MHPFRAERSEYSPEALRRIEGRHRAWRYRTRIDPAEVAWMRRTLQGGSAVVDAGAYKGGYTFWMRESVGESGLVYAFEPQPELAGFLVRSMDAFGWNNVRVSAIGLGSTAGEGTMHVPEAKPSQRGSLVVERASAHTYPVRVEALDDFLQTRPADRRIAFIKCDVEGSELDLFRGARRTLIDHRPTLLFEHEARFCPPRDAGQVFDYLEATGYRVPSSGRSSCCRSASSDSTSTRSRVIGPTRTTSSSNAIEVRETPPPGGKGRPRVRGNPFRP